MDAFTEALAVVLKLRRVELKMTVPRLAEATGISEQSLGRFLRGERAIHVAHFVAITQALRIAPGAALDAAHERIWDAS